MAAPVMSAMCLMVDFNFICIYYLLYYDYFLYFYNENESRYFYFVFISQRIFAEDDSNGGRCRQQTPQIRTYRSSNLPYAVDYEKESHAEE
jgi:hypothetical protein